MDRRRPRPLGGGRKEFWAPIYARDIQVAIALGRVERLAGLDGVTLDADSDVVGALRFLLVEDVLKHCAASHGMRLLVRPPPGISLDHTHPVPCISLACCGGCAIWGDRVIGGFPSEKCPTTTPATPIFEDVLYPIKVFLNQTAVIADGLKVSSRSVLRYLALTLESHFDTDRSDPVAARLDRELHRFGTCLTPATAPCSPSSSAPPAPGAPPPRPSARRSG